MNKKSTKLKGEFLNELQKLYFVNLSIYGEILAWQYAGVPNAAILKAATLNNAKALNIHENVGVLSTGKHADFVVLHANPLENMATLKSPLMTIKRGRQVKGEI